MDDNMEDFNQKPTTCYKSERWLNRETSPSTGSLVCYDGIVKDNEGEFRSTFVEIKDCNRIVKLHRAEYDTIQDFIDKLKTIESEVHKFIGHLEEV